MGLVAEQANTEQDEQETEVGRAEAQRSLLGEPAGNVLGPADGYEQDHADDGDGQPGGRHGPEAAGGAELAKLGADGGAHRMPPSSLGELEEDLLEALDLGAQLVQGDALAGRELADRRPLSGADDDSSPVATRRSPVRHRLRAGDAARRPGAR